MLVEKHACQKCEWVSHVQLVGLGIAGDRQGRDGRHEHIVRRRRSGSSHVGRTADGENDAKTSHVLDGDRRRELGGESFDVVVVRGDHEGMVRRRHEDHMSIDHVGGS